MIYKYIILFKLKFLGIFLILRMNLHIGAIFPQVPWHYILIIIINKLHITFSDNYIENKIEVTFSRNQQERNLQEVLDVNGRTIFEWILAK